MVVKLVQEIEDKMLLTEVVARSGVMMLFEGGIKTGVDSNLKQNEFNRDTSLILDLTEGGILEYSVRQSDRHQVQIFSDIRHVANMTDGDGICFKFFCQSQNLL